MRFFRALFWYTFCVSFYNSPEYAQIIVLRKMKSCFMYTHTHTYMFPLMQFSIFSKKYNTYFGSIHIVKFPQLF